MAILHFKIGNTLALDNKLMAKALEHYKICSSILQTMLKEDVIGAGQTPPENMADANVVKALTGLDDKAVILRDILVDVILKIAESESGITEMA